MAQPSREPNLVTGVNLEHPLPRLDPSDTGTYKAPPLKPGKKYHVFLSHSYEDIQFTKEICRILEDLGYKVFFADRDSIPGHSIIQEVSTKMKESDRVVMLVTPQFLQSNFFEFESNLAMMYGYERKLVTLVPVLCDVQHTDVPDEITSGPVYLNITDKKFWKRLFEALQVDAKSLAAVPAGDVAHGLAWSYYYGYLKLVLPANKERNTTDLGTRCIERCSNKNTWTPDCTTAIPFKRMIILVPKSCFCPSSLSQQDDNIVAPKDSQGNGIRTVFKASRAGHPERDYSGTLMLVKDPDSNKSYLSQVEFATPVMSMYEMVNQPGTQCGITKTALLTQRKLFVDKLRDIVGKCPLQCAKNVIILDYDDEKDPTDPHRLSRTLVNIMQKRLDMEQQLEKAKHDTRDTLAKLQIE